MVLGVVSYNNPDVVIVRREVLSAGHHITRQKKDAKIKTLHFTRKGA